MRYPSQRLNAGSFFARVAWLKAGMKLLAACEVYVTAPVSKLMSAALVLRRYSLLTELTITVLSDTFCMAILTAVKRCLKCKGTVEV